MLRRFKQISDRLDDDPLGAALGVASLFVAMAVLLSIAGAFQ